MPPTFSIKIEYHDLRFADALLITGNNNYHFVLVATPTGITLIYFAIINDKTLPLIINQNDIITRSDFTLLIMCRNFSIAASLPWCLRPKLKIASRRMNL